MLFRSGVGKVQEFETGHCPTLRSYEIAGAFPNPLKTCILLTPCWQLVLVYALSFPTNNLALVLSCQSIIKSYNFNSFVRWQLSFCRALIPISIQQYNFDALHFQNYAE